MASEAGDCINHALYNEYPILFKHTETISRKQWEKSCKQIHIFANKFELVSLKKVEIEDFDKLDPNFKNEISLNKFYN